MEAERRAQYGGLTRHIEEPIRELVPATWDLPFVVDMGFTCSGHILRGQEHGRGEHPDIGKYVWYPHRTMLEFAFSLDENLLEARDAFRRDLAAVSVESEGLRLGFNDVKAYEQDHLPYSKISHPNLLENYNGSVPEVEKSMEAALAVERLLGLFWEEVANVVRSHNSSASIGSIHGKNFRGRINWFDWKSVFLKNESESCFEESAEDLRQELDARGQFYFKGFGMILSDLLVNLEIYAVAEPTPQFADHIRLRLGQITELYKGIMFNEIKDHPDYDLLLEIRDSIAILQPLVEEIIGGKNDINDAHAVITMIHDRGQEYRARLMAIQSRLRGRQGHEQGGLISTSVIDGKVWSSALG